MDPETRLGWGYVLFVFFFTLLIAIGVHEWQKESSRTVETDESSAVSR
jgi:hypothetical protein